MSAEGIRWLQQELAGRGLYAGAIDGKWGPKTQAAVSGLLPAQAADESLGASLPVLPWISAMQSVLGLHELRDKAKLSAWLKSDGKTLGDPTALPWCGDAVDTAIAVGLPKEPRLGALGENPYWARNWALFGVACPPSYGCIAVFVRDGGGHVGFLVGEDATHYHVLGGNQGDAVSVVRIDKKRCIGTRWPATVADKPQGLPKMSASAAGVSKNEA